MRLKMVMSAMEVSSRSNGNFMELDCITIPVYQRCLSESHDYQCYNVLCFNKLCLLS